MTHSAKWRIWPANTFGKMMPFAKFVIWLSDVFGKAMHLAKWRILPSDAFGKVKHLPKWCVFGAENRITEAFLAELFRFWRFKSHFNPTNFNNLQTLWKLNLCLKFHYRNLFNENLNCEREDQIWYLHYGGVLLLKIHFHDRILRRPNVDRPALTPFKFNFFYI